MPIDTPGSRDESVRLGPDLAYTTHHQILLTYFTGRTTADSLRALHAAHMRLRARFPSGTVTLAVVGPGTAIPGRDVRKVAAQTGREASVGLLGEGVVLQGHAFWVAMARSALRAIQLLSHALHGRSIFESVDEGARWALGRAGRPAGEAPVVVAQLAALIDRVHEREAKGA